MAELVERMVLPRRAPHVAGQWGDPASTGKGEQMHNTGYTWSEETEIRTRTRRYILQILSITGGLFPIGTQNFDYEYPSLTGNHVRTAFWMAAKEMHELAVPGVETVWTAHVTGTDLYNMYSTGLVNLYKVLDDAEEPGSFFFSLDTTNKGRRLYVAAERTVTHQSADSFEHSLLIAEALSRRPLHVQKAFAAYGQRVAKIATLVGKLHVEEFASKVRAQGPTAWSQNRNMSTLGNKIGEIDKHAKITMEQLALVCPNTTHFITITRRGIVYAIEEGYFSRKHVAEEFARSLGFHSLASDIAVGTVSPETSQSHYEYSNR
jgi:hypothetical protein